jgi:hypothetical protein
MIGPKRPDANVCWCLSYRIPSKENLTLRGPARGAKVASLMEHGPSACWHTTATKSSGGRRSRHASIRRLSGVGRSPAQMTSTYGQSGASGCGRAIAARGSRTHFSPGLSSLHGPTGHRPSKAIPSTMAAQKVDLTMAYVRTRALFERAGFHMVAETTSVLNGFPRVVMRLELT